jgi:hypothetical protein
MTTEEVLKALGRYTEESRESDRQTATKLGINQMTLTAWLHVEIDLNDVCWPG